jgi:RNA polymerase sigma-70 factor (ECF subfamily)
MVKYLPRYRSGSTPFRAWLYRIATNQVNRWAARKRRWNWLPLGDHPATERQSTTDEATQIRRALLKLPVHYQSALALHYLEEMSLESVAQVLGCALGTVKSRLARGRAMLSTLLTQHENQGEFKPEEQS